MLEQCGCWVAWDDQPRDRGEWGGPHYCLGLVVTCPREGALWVQFAAGRNLRRWTDMAVRPIEKEARRQGCDSLRLCVRKGWRQEMTRMRWLLPVHIARDPEVLRVYPDHRAAARASA